MTTTILLVFQVILALGIIFMVLIQRSDSDGGLGMGSGSGSGLLSGRAKSNLLTRTTAILAALFMFNSLLLTILMQKENASSIADKLPDALPAAVEEQKAPETPAEPTTPVVPRAE